MNSTFNTNGTWPVPSTTKTGKTTTEEFVDGELVRRTVVEETTTPVPPVYPTTTPAYPQWTWYQDGTVTPISKSGGGQLSSGTDQFTVNISGVVADDTKDIVKKIQDQINARHNLR